MEKNLWRRGKHRDSTGQSSSRGSQQTGRYHGTYCCLQPWDDESIDSISSDEPNGGSEGSSESTPMTAVTSDTTEITSIRNSSVMSPAGNLSVVTTTKPMTAVISDTTKITSIRNNRPSVMSLTGNSSVGTTTTAIATTNTSNTTEITSLGNLSPTGNSTIETTSFISAPISDSGNVALAVALYPSISVIFLLFLLVGFILLRKYCLKKKRSKHDLKKSRSDGAKLGTELGHVKDLLNSYTEVNEDGKERKPAIGKQSDQEGAILPGIQSKDGYKENILEVTQSNRGYQNAENKRRQDDEGYETAKTSDPAYHTLDPHNPADDCYDSVTMSKQNGEYDKLDRKQDPIRPNSERNDAYDLTERIGKGDAKVGPSIQIDSEYSSMSKTSGNTSVYDKLDHTRGRCEVVNISPNDYNVLQPREKK